MFVRLFMVFAFAFCNFVSAFCPCGPNGCFPDQIQNFPAPMTGDEMPSGDLLRTDPSSDDFPVMDIGNNDGLSEDSPMMDREDSEDFKDDMDSDADQGVIQNFSQDNFENPVTNGSFDDSDMSSDSDMGGEGY